MASPMCVINIDYGLAVASVLLGLACFAQDLTDFTKTGGSHDSKEYTAASVNVVADMAALTFIFEKVQKYDHAARAAARITRSGGTLSELNGPAGGTRDTTDVLALGELHCIAPIVQVLTLVEGSKLLAGYGSPYEGGDFKRGSEELAVLGEQLISAFPDDRFWTGDSAELYSGELTKLRAALATAAEFDKRMAAAAQDQADVVFYTRLALGVLESILVTGGFIIRNWYVKCPESYVSLQSWAYFLSLLGNGILVLILGLLPGVCSLKQMATAGHIADHSPDVQVGSMRDESVRAEVVAAPEARIAGFAEMVTNTSTMSVRPEVTTVSGAGAQPVAYSFPDLHFASQTPAQRFAPVAQSHRRSGTSTHWPAVSTARKVAFAEDARAADGGLDGIEAGAGTWAPSERAPVEVAADSPAQGGSSWRI